MKSMLSIVFLVIAFAAGMAIFAAVFFGVAFALLDYLSGVEFNGGSGQTLGLRVGAAASVLGGIIGAALGFSLGMDWLKRSDGKTNWPACMAGGLVAAALAIVLLYGGGVNAFWAIVHYKYFGFAMLAGFMGMVGWIERSLSRPA